MKKYFWHLILSRNKLAIVSCPFVSHGNATQKIKLPNEVEFPH